MKCNDDPRVLRELHALSSGFDCASQAEMEAVLALGEEEGARCVNASEDIVFANPVKSPKQLSYAERAGVGMVTFDNADELRKIKALHPGASVILRICPETDDVARCPMGSKYGCPMDRVPELLRLASALDLDVAGVSYHVSSATDGAFTDLDAKLLLVYVSTQPMGQAVRLQTIEALCSNGQCVAQTAITAIEALNVLQISAAQVL